MISAKKVSDKKMELVIEGDMEELLMEYIGITEQIYKAIKASIKPGIKPWDVMVKIVAETLHREDSKEIKVVDLSGGES